MTPITNPALCVICDCGSVIMASLLREDIPIADGVFKEFLDYAIKGYEIKVAQASESNLEDCKCHT